MKRQVTFRGGKKRFLQRQKKKKGVILNEKNRKSIK